MNYKIKMHLNINEMNIWTRSAYISHHGATINHACELILPTTTVTFQLFTNGTSHTFSI